MKQMKDWAMIGVGIFGFLLTSPVLSLAVVESRTGEPVYRNQHDMSSNQGPSRDLRSSQDNYPQSFEPTYVQSNSPDSSQPSMQVQDPSHGQSQGQSQGYSQVQSQGQSQSYRHGQRHNQVQANRTQSQTQTRSQRLATMRSHALANSPSQSQSQERHPVHNHTQNQGQATLSNTDERRAGRLTLNQVEALQREVTELRGTIEMQDHEIKQLKKSQQDLFSNLEKRINDMNAVKPNSNSKNQGSLASASQASQITVPGTNTATAANKPSNKASSNINMAPAKTYTKESPMSSREGADQNAGGQKGVQNVNGQTNIATEMDENNPDVVVDEDLEQAVSIRPAAMTKNSANKSEALSGDIGIVQGPSKTKAINTSHLNEKDAYQAAYNYVRTKRYPEAIMAFQDYLKRFPKGEQAANAHYWLGEVYVVEWQADKNKADNLEKASQEFSNVTAAYPSHPKVGDAILKLGLIELDRGNIDVAKQHLEEVKLRFPGTAAARIADTRIKQIKVNHQ